MNKELFKHELCTDFRINYEIDDEEAKRFHESFCHFHKIMTDINGSWVMNTIWLNENYFDLWNNNTPQEMIQLCIKHAVEHSIGVTAKISSINKDKPKEEE